MDFSKHREKVQDFGLLILRVGIGGMMAWQHGWPKFEKFSTLSSKFADPLGVGSSFSLTLAIGGELICGILIVFGLATRIAAVPFLITMLVAAFIVHGDDPFKKQEFALLYAIPALALIFTGPGKFSIDRYIMPKKYR